MVWQSLETISSLLEPAERQQVLGDIHERGPNLRAVLDLLGLVLLRQLQAWTSWRPWLMAGLLALPAVYAGFSTHPIAYIARTGHLIAFERGAGTFVIRPWVALEAPASAWAIGFVLGRLGKRKTASVLPFLILFSAERSYEVARSSLRLELPPAWTTRFQLDFSLKHQIAASVQRWDETDRFIAAFAVMVLLTTIPYLWGFARALRQQPLNSLAAAVLVALCLTDSPLFVRLATPIAVAKKLVALWPVVYLLAVSRRPFVRITPQSGPRYN